MAASHSAAFPPTREDQYRMVCPPPSSLDSSISRTQMSSSTPLLQDIIFPSQSHTPQLNRHLSKRPLTAHNRLASIAHDAAYVDAVAAELGLPVIANERCGSWYVRPELKAGSAYFKSTDGHWGVWAWSRRRLNVGVLEVVGEGGGCIIVDSTRKGKHMPDALSKTVPIWIAVMNRLLFPDETVFHALERFPELISKSEHDQIEARLEGFVENAKQLDLDVQTLRAQVRKPMRPVWICRSLDIPSRETKADTASQDRYSPVYLCMASEFQDADDYNPNAAYVQGSGDDAEGWAHGLTANVFWQNQETLLTTSEEDLPETIARLMKVGKKSISEFTTQYVLSSGHVAIGIIPGDIASFDDRSHYIICASDVDESWKEKLKKRLLHLQCGSGKLGSRELRNQLPKIPDFLPGCKSIVVLDLTGKDLAVGVALTILCLYTDEAGIFNLDQKIPKIDKDVIRKKLGWIMTRIPNAAPSRATLNAVNAFLMKQAE